jgi:hypothetical protein
MNDKDQQSAGCHLSAAEAFNALEIKEDIQKNEVIRQVAAAFLFASVFFYPPSAT